MKATRAYITGLGTTGVLLCFALLLLVVVSAIVTFRGWPAGAGFGADPHGGGGVVVGGACGPAVESHDRADDHEQEHREAEEDPGGTEAGDVSPGGLHWRGTRSPFR